ncbi:histidine phosphatase family protein [Priestia koreensis]|uniref:histidine phosphatase family protein n=1 Tax=Priestia koreensis TaxID=284581 RepID=UPI001F5A7A01|nr:histidine phosphatase family protein [Priestia koreensis]UNL82964.1 histidine phosphatase family protein [Priestia koreensis]
MSKKVFLVRHCQAKGQEESAILTEEGFLQAEALSRFFEPYKIDHIISSPFTRALQTIEPTARVKGIKVEEDVRLMERILSATPMNDWYEKLEKTFQDLDLSYEGGESSLEAMRRAQSVIQEIADHEAECIVLVTHGNLLALLLKSYDSMIGFQQWADLRNPDVFLLELKNFKTKRLYPL